MRVDVIDIIKGISIIMIVNVHLLSGQFFPIGCTYHVIAFFFTAGLVNGMTEKWKQKTLRSFAKRRIKQLGHPYLFLSLCYILMHMALNILRGNSFINYVITDSFLKTISFRGIGTLWFLPVLFLGEFVFWGAKRKNLHSLFLVFIGVGMIFLTSYLNNLGLLDSMDSLRFSAVSLGTPIRIVLTSVIASSIIALGDLIYRFIPLIFQDSYFESKKRFVCLVFFCVISFIIDYLLIGLYQGDLHKLDINNPVVYIICSVAGLSFVTSLSLIIKRISGSLTRLLKYLGRNSLIIMTTHAEYYINSIANIIIVSLISLFGITMPTRIVSGIALLVILLFEIGIVYIVNHSFIRRVFFAKIQ